MMSKDSGSFACQIARARGVSSIGEFGRSGWRRYIQVEVAAKKPRIKISPVGFCHAMKIVESYSEAAICLMGVGAFATVSLASPVALRSLGVGGRGDPVDVSCPSEEEFCCRQHIITTAGMKMTVRARTELDLFLVPRIPPATPPTIAATTTRTITSTMKKTFLRKPHIRGLSSRGTCSSRAPRS